MGSLDIRVAKVILIIQGNVCPPRPSLFLDGEAWNDLMWCEVEWCELISSMKGPASRQMSEGKVSLPNESSAAGNVGFVLNSISYFTMYFIRCSLFMKPYHFAAAVVTTHIWLLAHWLHAHCTGYTYNSLHYQWNTRLIITRRCTVPRSVVSRSRSAHGHLPTYISLYLRTTHSFWICLDHAAAGAAADCKLIAIVGVRRLVPRCGVGRNLTFAWYP